MHFQHWLRFSRILCVSALAASLSNCGVDSQEAIAPSTASPAATPAAAQPEPAAATPSPQATTAPSPSARQRNLFREGVNRAQSAVAIGQSAQSPSDWNLAASRWQQAVQLMQQVPESDPNYATAQKKIEEYQQNLATVKRQAAGEAPASSGNSATSAANRPNGLVARIPILGRAGGTPVVPVTLTGNSGRQQFQMLFDTGATGTLITPAMANAVGVVIVDQATFTVADGRQVTMPIGYVDTLQVGDLVVRDVLVGIGGDMALLGQNIYGEYGISLGASRIDLYQ